MEVTCPRFIHTTMQYVFFDGTKWKVMIFLMDHDNKQEWQTGKLKHFISIADSDDTGVKCGCLQ